MAQAIIVGIGGDWLNLIKRMRAGPTGEVPRGLFERL